MASGQRIYLRNFTGVGRNNGNTSYMSYIVRYLVQPPCTLACTYMTYIEGVSIISSNPVDMVVVEFFRHREEYFERLEISLNLRTEEKGETPETLVGC